jgi:hypothetical protein
MEGAMIEFWVSLTVAELGRDEDNGSRLFEALEAVPGVVDPLVHLNFEHGWLSGELEVEAADAKAAVERARPMFEAALAGAGLPSTRLVGIEVRLPEMLDDVVPAA